MAKFIDGAGVERTMVRLTLGTVAKVKAGTGVELDKFFQSPDAMNELMFTRPADLAALAAELSGVPVADREAFLDAIDGDTLDRIRQSLLETVADFCLPLHARGNFKARIPAFLADPGSFLSDGSTTGSASPVASA